MIDAKELVSRYVAVWNEPDAQARRKEIAALWKEDGAHYTKSIEARGYDALEARVASAYERFVGNGRYVFRAIDNVDCHHNTVKFNWAMVPASGGDVESVGFDFFILDTDGRIAVDYQFIEP